MTRKHPTDCHSCGPCDIPTEDHESPEPSDHDQRRDPITGELPEVTMALEKIGHILHGDNPPERRLRPEATVDDIYAEFGEIIFGVRNTRPRLDNSYNRAQDRGYYSDSDDDEYSFVPRKRRGYSIESHGDDNHNDSRQHRASSTASYEDITASNRRYYRGPSPESHHDENSHDRRERCVCSTDSYGEFVAYNRRHHPGCSSESYNDEDSYDLVRRRGYSTESHDDENSHDRRSLGACSTDSYGDIIAYNRRHRRVYSDYSDHEVAERADQPQDHDRARRERREIEHQMTARRTNDQTQNNGQADERPNNGELAGGGGRRGGHNNDPLAPTDHRGRRGAVDLGRPSEAERR